MLTAAPTRRSLRGPQGLQPLEQFADFPQAFLVRFGPREPRDESFRRFQVDEGGSTATDL